MIKQKNIILIGFLLVFIWGIKSCYKKIGCDGSSEVELGKVEHSELFKGYNIEVENDTIIFVTENSEIVFVRSNKRNKKLKRFNEYDICTSIDLYPYTAHAYYVYDDLGSVFRADSAILVIDPNIEKIGRLKGESLFLSFNFTREEGVKGRIPVNNIDTTLKYEPYGELFEHNDEVTLSGNKFQDVWLFKRRNAIMYYSKSLGILAMKTKTRIFIRKELLQINQTSKIK